MTDGLRTWISPISPGARTAPLSRSATRNVTPSGGSPAESSRHAAGSADRVDGDDRHLARPVGRKPAHAGALGDHLGHGLAHRRRPPHDVAQRRQVELLEVGMVGHGQRDRRHRHLEGHPLRLDAVQHLVQVEAPDAAGPWRRPGAAASRLSSPRMCDGGVATWKRSSGPRPSAWHQCAVAWPIERWVWRTAFGSPVVPELNTSTASSVSLGLGDRRVAGRRLGRRPLHRPVVDVGDPARPEQLGQQRRGRSVAPPRGPGRSAPARARPRPPSTPGSAAPRPRRAC